MAELLPLLHQLLLASFESFIIEPPVGFRERAVAN
jgi:hypothetical protein